MNAREWNELYPVGTDVAVKLENGDTWITTTRSKAWERGGVTSVVMLGGRTAAFELSRVEAFEDV